MARRHHAPEGVLSRVFAAALLAFLAAGGVCCDLFETRSATEPGAGLTFFCLSLDAPGNVFANISRAYGRGEGLGCYFSTLKDPGFVFHADPTDEATYPGRFDSWTEVVEKAVAQNIANGADSLFLQLREPFEPVVMQPDVETRRYTYEIKFKGAAISDTLFQGLATITIRKSSGGQWLVEDWVDRRDPGGTTLLTWGYLRGSYRTGI